MNNKKTLSDLISSISGARLATADEAKSLADYSKSQFMALNGFGVGFDRGDDFFALYKAYAKDYWVIVNQGEKFWFVACLTIFDVRVDGQKKRAGYFGDLRIDSTSTKEDRRRFRELYQLLVNHVQDPESPEYCDYLLGAILKENLKALHVLTAKLEGMKYTQVAQYWTLSIFSNLFSKSAPKSFSVSEVPVGEVEKLSRPALGFDPLPTGEMHQPLIARDGQRDVMGTIVWDASKARRLVVFGLPFGLKVFFKTLSVLTGKEYSENTPWPMVNLSSLSDHAGDTTETKVNALTALCQFCFQTKAFHILNVTVMNRELKNGLQKKFPISKMSSGFIFEITAGTRQPTLVGKDVVFEGAFL